MEKYAVDVLIVRVKEWALVFSCIVHVLTWRPSSAETKWKTEWILHDLSRHLLLQCLKNTFWLRATRNNFYISPPSPYKTSKRCLGLSGYSSSTPSSTNPPHTHGLSTYPSSCLEDFTYPILTPSPNTLHIRNLPISSNFFLIFLSHSCSNRKLPLSWEHCFHYSLPHPSDDLHFISLGLLGLMLSLASFYFSLLFSNSASSHLCLKEQSFEY